MAQELCGVSQAFDGGFSGLSNRATIGSRPLLTRVSSKGAKDCKRVTLRKQMRYATS
jgi:hypothetical protein